MLLDKTPYNVLRASTQSYEPDEEQKQNNFIVSSPYQQSNYNIANNYNTQNYHMPSALNSQKIINMPSYQNFGNYKSTNPSQIIHSPTLNLNFKTFYNNIPSYSTSRNPYGLSNGKNLNYSQIVYPQTKITHPAIYNKNSNFITPIKHTKYVSKTPLNNSKLMYSFNMSKHLNFMPKRHLNFNMNGNIMPYNMKQLSTNIVGQNAFSLNKNVVPVHRFVFSRKF